MTDDMLKKVEGELAKVRNYPKWNFSGFAYPHEIDDVRERLKLSGIRFRTEIVYDDKDKTKIKGWKVYTLG